MIPIITSRLFLFYRYPPTVIIFWEIISFISSSPAALPVKNTNDVFRDTPRARQPRVNVITLREYQIASFITGGPGGLGRFSYLSSSRAAGAAS